MKKKVFTLLFALVAIATTAQAQVVLNETNFPDRNFRKTLAEKLGINEGDEISAEQIANMKELDARFVQNWKGIEFFTELTKLECGVVGEGKLTLDVSKNTKLEYLSCRGVVLESLDVSKNTALKYLKISFSVLSSLDVSKNTALEELQIIQESGYFARLTDLNVSGAIALKKLECTGTALTSLDLSQNTALTDLLCRFNDQLTSLDVSKNATLERLECYNNQLTSLDLTNNTALTELNCSNNQLAELDLSNQKNLEIRGIDVQYPTTKGVKLADGRMGIDLGGEGFDWSRVSELRGDGKEMEVVISGQYLVIADNVNDCPGHVTYQYDTQYPTEATIMAVVITVDLNEFPSGILLNEENFPDANFRAALASKFGISKGDELSMTHIRTTSIDVGQKSIADLTGIEHFTKLAHLRCYNNQLTSLDLSKNTALTWLECWGNQLSSLDVSKNTALTRLECWGNQLSSLDVSKNTALTRLECPFNQLTLLDVSQNTALTYLSCRSNQLTLLDVSQNTALTSLECDNNQLTSLDVSQNTALTDLYCWSNQLTLLDVSQNTALRTLSCDGNQIKGEAMDALVASLPMVPVGSGLFYVINTKDDNEGNVCTKSQVAVAKEKGWTARDRSNRWQEYEGSEDPEQEIDPVDEGDNVDFCNDMDENSNLDGNVIGNIYYNVGDGNGEYDAENGCVVIKKTTDDGAVNDLEGKDIFGDDFKGTFTGIVFKVPTGKGTVKVTAETTGNMLLKVKIGSDEPVEMELEGKLKISFPYNVTSESLVYIYAGTSAEAKGFGKTSATDAALKIYGIEFLKDDTTPIDRPTPDNSLNEGENWYTIDGVKLNGEPTKKGVYVVNGRKVVK